MQTGGALAGSSSSGSSKGFAASCSWHGFPSSGQAFNKPLDPHTNGN
jgi:hypothetical protein